MRSRISKAGWLMLACCLNAPLAIAQDAKAGREKAVTCSVCHGRDGIAVAPNAPNLAGENAVYIAEQLKAFKSGKRNQHQMSIIAKGLSNSDIDNLSLWYSLIKVEAILPDL